MMKKALSLVLVMLTVFALVGCNKDAGENKPVDVVSPTATPAASALPTATPGADEKPEFAPRAKPVGMVAVGNVHTVGLRADGTVITAGRDTHGQRNVSDWENIAFIAAAANYTAGVTISGEIKIAGEFAAKDTLTKENGWSGLVAVAATDDNIVGLRADGTVIASAGSADLSAWAEVVQVAAGEGFTLGLTVGGEVLMAGESPLNGTYENVIDISAGGKHASVVLKDGTFHTTAASEATGTGAVLSATGALGTVIIKEDGSVLTFLNEEIEGVGELSTIAGFAVGNKHLVAMEASGLAYAFGDNSSLQCRVGKFFLRPMREPTGTVASGYFALGFRLNMTVAEAEAALSATARTGVKIYSNNAAAAPDAIVATGMEAMVGDVKYATVVILGDVTGDGQITTDDTAAFTAYAKGEKQFEGAFIRAAQAAPTVDHLAIRLVTVEIDGELKNYYTSSSGNRIMGGFAAVSDYLSNKGKIAQTCSWQATEIYMDYVDAFNANNHTVGYAKIEGTNIDYPIMYDATGKYYYNDHTPEKEKKASGSLYTISYGYTQNNVFTGHNSRPSGTMLHQLHHIQEYNNGHKNCLQERYCGMELTDKLPDLKNYDERVFTFHLFGVEGDYELFSMYETKAGVKMNDTLYPNIWYKAGKYNFAPQSETEISAWIDKQISLSEVEIDTKVTADDTYLTIYSCGTEHEDSNKNSRIYMFFKRVG